LGVIRLLLALSVLVAHSAFNGKLMAPGDIAVQLFFIISGFYMAMILNTKYENHTGAFYKNRFFRLYPIYLTVVVLVLLVGFLTRLGVGHPVNNWDSVASDLSSGVLSLGTAVFLTFSNITMLFQDLVMFLRLDGGNPVPGYYGDSVPPLYTYLWIPQAWSLSLEILFYALAPFLIRKKKTVGIVLALSVAVRLVLHFTGHDSDPFSYRFFPSELSVFLLGAGSWHLFRDHRSPILAKNAVAFQVGLVAVIVAWPLLFNFNDLGRYLFFVPFALLVPYLYDHYKDRPWDNRIGELSYPFYLTHVLALQLAALVVGPNWSSPRIGQGIQLILAAVLATGVSFVLVTWVQSPFEKLRRRTLTRMGPRS
jgi:peptidoglycan/LPS O-acetylase OafA/YrhL